MPKTKKSPNLELANLVIASLTLLVSILLSIFIFLATIKENKKQINESDKKEAEEQAKVQGTLMGDAIFVILQNNSCLKDIIESLNKPVIESKKDGVMTALFVKRHCVSDNYISEYKEFSKLSVYYKGAVLFNNELHLYMIDYRAFEAAYKAYIEVFDSIIKTDPINIDKNALLLSMIENLKFASIVLKKNGEKILKKLQKEQYLELSRPDSESYSVELKKIRY